MSGEAHRILLAADFHLKYAAGLARGLADAGGQVALLTRDHGLEFGGDPDEMRSALHDRLEGRVPTWTMPGRAGDVRTLAAVARLHARRRAFAPDVVHIQQAILNDPRLVVAAGVRPGRYALTIHDVEIHPGDAQPSRARREAERRLVRHAGLVFVHAEALVDGLRRTTGTRAPIEVVPHGAHLPPARPLPDRPTVLAFGRISAYKGIDVLLDAAPRLWDRVPEARIVISGEGDLVAHPALDDARVEVRNEHVPERDVPELFADCTCAVLPYIEASQSGVGSRAKGYGRGLVVTDVGGLPELAVGDAGLVVPPRDPVALADALAGVLLDRGLVVTDVGGLPELAAGGAGLVVAPRDPGALADALAGVLLDRALAERLGAAARATLEAQASWERVAERTLDAYRRHRLLS